MVRAIGVDPGTVSFDVCGLEDGHVFMDATLPTAEVGAEPRLLVDLLRAAAPVDMIIAPSGYGLPWVRIQEFGRRERLQYILARKKGRGSSFPIRGMAEIVRLLRESDLPATFMPAVIHLPTVPQHRKVNKIDLGTADKLCCAVLGVYDQARHYGIAYEETSFILIEVGGAFTAVMAVEGGKVVDGQGGTNACLGYRSLGAIKNTVQDVELESNVKGFDLFATATFSFTMLEVFAKAGYFWSDSEFKVADASESINSSDFSWGVGAGVSLGKFGVRAEWESLKVKDLENPAMLTASLEYIIL